MWLYISCTLNNCHVVGFWAEITAEDREEKGLISYTIPLGSDILVAEVGTIPQCGQYHDIGTHFKYKTNFIS
jgi:hypothetical protein